METSTQDMGGRVALVTGGGRGIGRAIALGLCARGARVAVLARSVSELEATVQLAHERGGAALAVPADVAESDQVARAVELVTERFGPVDVLVNNAGVVGPLGRTPGMDVEQWASAQAINVTAPLRLSLAVLPSMLANGWGRIVNISSGIVANPAGMVRANAYATSKSALEAHTLNLAAELAGTGVSVNVYRPGGVDTAMQAFIRGQNPDHVGAELHDRFVRNHRDHSLITPEQSAASLLARLTSNATGQVWDADDPIPTTTAP